jgi:hypothetical protein
LSRDADALRDKLALVKKTVEGLIVTYIPLQIAEIKKAKISDIQKEEMKNILSLQMTRFRIVDDFFRMNRDIFSPQTPVDVAIDKTSELDDILGMTYKFLKRNNLLRFQEGALAKAA